MARQAPNNYLISGNGLIKQPNSTTMRNNDFGNKPDHTKIKLTKGGDFFEIYIPSVGFHPLILFVAPLAIVWNGFNAVWLFVSVQAPWPTNILTIIFSLPFLMIGGFLVFICLFCLFGKTYLRIDRHEIFLVRTLFEQKIGRSKCIPKRGITRIVFTHEYTVHDSDGSSQIPAELKLETKTKSIAIGGKKGDIKHENEVEWLAVEVGEWLDKSLVILKKPLPY
jgi:hypothetical protein